MQHAGALGVLRVDPATYKWQLSIDIMPVTHCCTSFEKITCNSEPRLTKIAGQSSACVCWWTIHHAVKWSYLIVAGCYRALTRQVSTAKLWISTQPSADDRAKCRQLYRLILCIAGWNIPKH